jgi:transposase
MKPITNEIRKLIVAAKERGEKDKDIAIWYDISGRSVQTIYKLYRETGSYLPTPYPGRKPVITPKQWAEVVALVSRNPDKTLDEIIEELQLPIHKSRLSVLLIEAGYSFKKRVFIQPNKTAKTSGKSEKNLLKQ